MRRMAPAINTLLALIAFASIATGGTALEPAQPDDVRVPERLVASSGEAATTPGVHVGANPICTTGYETTTLSPDRNPLKVIVSAVSAL